MGFLQVTTGLGHHSNLMVVPALPSSGLYSVTLMSCLDLAILQGCGPQSGAVLRIRNDRQLLDQDMQATWAGGDAIHALIPSQSRGLKPRGPGLD